MKRPNRGQRARLALLRHVAVEKKGTHFSCLSRLSGLKGGVGRSMRSMRGRDITAIPSPTCPCSRSHHGPSRAITSKIYSFPVGLVSILADLIYTNATTHTNTHTRSSLIISTPLHRLFELYWRTFQTPFPIQLQRLRPASISRVAFFSHTRPLPPAQSVVLEQPNRIRSPQLYSKLDCLYDQPDKSRTLLISTQGNTRSIFSPHLMITRNLESLTIMGRGAYDTTGTIKQPPPPKK